MLTSLMRGALAGAAGTTALNAATYLDMVVRARPSSSLPEQAVEKAASQAAVEIPGEGEERANRLEGLAPLGGIATGVAIGVAAGILRPAFVRLPFAVGATLLGAAAMAAANAPMTRMRLTDPRKWSSSDWMSDAVPHLAYGAAALATLRHEGE